MRAHIYHRLNLQIEARYVPRKRVVGDQVRRFAVPRVALADGNVDVGNSLLRSQIVQRPPQIQAPIGSDREPVAGPDVPAVPPEILVVLPADPGHVLAIVARSEEHTSELQ